MPTTSLLDRANTVVLLIDLQESYRSVLHGWAGVERNCVLAVQGAALLGLPIVVTEQYPRGLGHTAPAVAKHLPPDTPLVEKLTMSCCGAPGFLERLAATSRRQVLVTGIETHACVNQTVQELRGLGFEVHVARDATSSRLERFVAPAWERMMTAGALPTTVEQALLEAVRSAAAPEFRQLQQLFKEAATP
jgi:nicotinamidase-related amidase